MLIRILSLVLLAMGAVVVYGAKLINKKLGIEARLKAPKDFEFKDREDEEKYMQQKALAAIKVFGLVFLIPGIILVFIAFR